jgi:peptidyl-prolyl cis-trans isomerase B (cyclophilin B)
MKYLILTCIVLLANLNLLVAEDPSTLLNENNPRYRISVTHGGESIGEMIIELFPEVAPKHVHNFDSLVSIGFYNGTAFHRVIPNFMIQGGDPNSKDKPEDTWGYGDPSQTKVPAEFSSLKHERGIVSAARAVDINSATSQFFICVAKASHLDGKYSIYGQVIEGMEIADIIVNVPRDLTTNRPYAKVEMTITKIDPTDVKESKNNLSNSIISPNPASDFIEINLGNVILSEAKDLKIYNALGQCVIYLKEDPSDGETTRIDISQLPEGVYFVSYHNLLRLFIKQ